MRIYLGTCGNRVGLEKYLELFNALEINATFYRFPPEKTLRRWERVFRSREGFGLSLKVFQGLTHPVSSPTWRRAGLAPEERERLRNLAGCLRLNPATEEFLERTIALTGRLSARFLLFQLPRVCAGEAEGFFAFFVRLRELLPPGTRAGLEIRWEDPGLLEDLFHRFGVIPVFDPLLFPGLLERFRNLPFLYFRLHGERKGGRLDYRKNYTNEELKRLADLVFGLEAEEVWILFNNIPMHENALRFREKFVITRATYAKRSSQSPSADR
ncbi:DUF72 domain-containing protein [Thermosulfurimonas sp. F29]|uniref:DUF72 domain-containing protein n=1 Tax=Thermosulfurimonas sp. F29 TaxID=2867247 RepID=UPI001C82F8ED|nr:DUF72 domain-containing protein [Thermosulfurimonas sp. F29]MBX6422094.1 DUF72 domain-containing protein [Thermosulfurimonas sp. F29]